jgi:hypothetical protein
MPVMSDQEKQTGPEDHRSKPRWSANKKMDAVLRLLRGEPLDQLTIWVRMFDAHRHPTIIRENASMMKHT